MPTRVAPARARVAPALARVALAPALAAVMLVLAGCGGSGDPSSATQPVAGTNASAGTPRDRGTASGSDSTPRRSVPSARARLGGALRRALARAGPATGALVYDLDADREVFALRDRVKRPPASVEKLYTTTAVLDLLGADTRLRTAVLGTGHLGAGGVWEGNLYLRGGGDPTFGDGAFNRIWEQGYGPTAAQLAEQLRARGIRRVAGRLIADESLFDQRRAGEPTRFRPDVPDFGGQLSALTYDHGATARKLGPGAFAATELARTLRAQHVAARAVRRTARTPRHVVMLARVSSPPMSVLLRLTDVPSDDLFAEMLTKQLGVRFGSGGTTAAGARVVAHVLASFGIHPKIVDGSGLSRGNRSSPAEVVALLRLLWHTDIGRVLAESLPVVGVSGTVRSLATRTAAQGRCIAKTGTLNDVTNLAGICAARGRHTLAFAVFLDGPENWQALGMLGKMVAAIGAY